MSLRSWIPQFEDFSIICLHLPNDSTGKANSYMSPFFYRQRSELSINCHKQCLCFYKRPANLSPTPVYKNFHSGDKLSPNCPPFSQRQKPPKYGGFVKWFAIKSFARGDNRPRFSNFSICANKIQFSRQVCHDCGHYRPGSSCLRGSTSWSYKIINSAYPPLVLTGRTNGLVGDRFMIVTSPPPPTSNHLKSKVPHTLSRSTLS